MIVRIAQNNQKVPMKLITDELATVGETMSLHMVSKSLGRRPLETYHPLLQHQHCKFAEDQTEMNVEFWEKILWSDETSYLVIMICHMLIEK